MLKFELRSVFGRIRIYPVCDGAKAACLVAGSMTLPRTKLMWLRSIIECDVVLNGLDLDGAE